MKQSAHTEEKCRLDLASAAIDVAGTANKHFLLDDILPQERRVYLFAVPDAAAGGDGPGISGMVKSLEASGVPHASDWDRKSDRYGLRYLPDFVRVPPELRRFTGPEAEKSWADWRAQEKRMDGVVADLAATLVRNPGLDLDATREPRVAEKAEGVSGRRRPGVRRMSSGERS